MSIAAIISEKTQKAKDQYPEASKDCTPDLADGINFMLYALNVIFQDFDFEKLEDGIVDSAYRSSTHDYGIDAVYITCNGSNINSIEELEEFNSDSKLEFHILQFKKGQGADQASFLKLKDGIKKCFIEFSCESELNEYLYTKFQILTEIRNKVYGIFEPENIKLSIYYVFSGLKENVLSDILLTDQIEDTKKILRTNCYPLCNYEIIGGQELINLEKKGKEIVDLISYENTFKYITATNDSTKLTGHICIVKGSEIAELVKKYQTSLFESNIRDFYRKNDLNSTILKTSSDANEAKYFWSYNNGLTITCRKVDELPGSKYRLHGIQIVNGCQTSNALYQAFRNKALVESFNTKGIDKLSKSELKVYESAVNLQLNDDTTILARIIETNDPNLTYRITETTNSQTPIKSFSLKANDDIQKNIHEYLLQKNIYYERRINFYKNQGRRNPVSIQTLFQLYVAHVLYRPSQVKTRPASMFQDFYDEVFPSPAKKAIDYSIYLVSIRVDLALKHYIARLKRTHEETDSYLLQLFANGRLHLGCLFLHSILEHRYNQKGIIKNAHIVLDILDSEDEEDFTSHFYQAASDLKKILQNYIGQKKESIVPALRKTELDNRIQKFIKTSEPGIHDN
jgi:hypothetical protein